MNIALDHAGVAVRDLDAAGREWTALGFQVTPTAPHLPAGITGNRCVMFAHGYVELIAVIAQGGHSATLARFLQRYQGIHIISLATDDAEAAGARLGQSVIRSERATEHGIARFARVALTEMVPRLQLIQHFTPALVWQPPTLVHTNRATALASIVIQAAAPAALAAELAGAAGVCAVPDPAGGYILRLAQGKLRVLADVAGIFPTSTAPSLPFVAGIEVATADAGRVGSVGFASGVRIRFIAEKT